MNPELSRFERFNNNKKKYFKAFLRSPIGFFTPLMPNKFRSFFDARLQDKQLRYKKTIEWAALNEFRKTLFKDLKLGESISLENFLKDKRINSLKDIKKTKFLDNLLKLSDKSTAHNYHYIYQIILEDLLKNNTGNINIAELGIGTFHLDIPSNMFLYGEPGASLRAFRNYDKRIFVTGGDIDKRILFNEDRIQTFYVDQLKMPSLEEFMAKKDFNLIIDDGLHYPHSNLNFLSCAIKKYIQKSGTWIVIEDIEMATEDFWLSIIKVLESFADIWLVKASKNQNILMLVIKIL